MEMTKKEEKKSELDRQYEIIEFNGYLAPRYKREETERIMQYTDMVMLKRFPELFNQTFILFTYGENGYTRKTR